MDYLLGIDLGTTGCKGALYDVRGKLLAQSYREYKIISPQSGLAEEDPREWWAKSIEIIREVMEKIPGSKERIASIGVSCTNALVPVDQGAEPLMNAIMQLDQRAVEEVERIRDILTPERIFAVTGNRIAPGTMSAPTIMWLKNKRPEIYRKTHKFLVPSGFLVAKLTGEFTIDYSRASTTSLFHVVKQDWDTEIINSLGIDMDKLPSPSSSHQVVGKVSQEASRLTGLVSGTPVIAGAMDTVAAGLGLGSVKEEEPFLILGTVGRICAGLKNPRFNDKFLNSSFIPNLPYLLMAPLNGAGNSLRWFRDVFGEKEILEGKERGISVYGVFDQEASQAPLGSKGLIYLPYLAGERSPYWDSRARGVFFGISLRHEKKDFIRAIMEGIAFGLRDNLEIMRTEMGLDVNVLRTGGGGAASDFWKRVIADTLNVELVQTENPESETLGAAILAGTGVGIYQTIPDGVRATVRDAERILPDRDKNRLYTKYYNVYHELYHHLKNSFRVLDQVVQSTEN